MIFETARLKIVEYDFSFVQSGQRLSVEQSNRKFIPDEVLETEADARKCTEYLISAYDNPKGPFVYLIVLKESDTHIGHIQICRLGKDRWEVGYHVGEDFEGNGYATEAAKALFRL